MSQQQSSFWPEGFAGEFFPGRYEWSQLGAYEALEPSNIKAALEKTKGSMVSDVIAALVFEVDCCQITMRAQEETIDRMRSNSEVSGCPLAGATGKD